MSISASSIASLPTLTRLVLRKVNLYAASFYPPRPAWTPLVTIFESLPCARREPFNFTTMGVNSTLPAHLHVRPTGRTCR